MLSASSSAFIKEFTIYCDRVNDENESLVVMRSNDKNIVVLSLDEYNRMKKQIFDLSNQSGK